MRQEAIEEQVRPGDILLMRKTLDPVRQTVDNEVLSFWREAYLYVGDGKVIQVSDGKFGIWYLYQYFPPSQHIGLFRSAEGLTKKEGQKLIHAARKMLGIRYNLWRLFWNFLRKISGSIADPDLGLWYKTAMSGSEFIAGAYAKIGKHFESGLTPVDFDRSELTVRIM